jgi:hypothetical protein
MLKFIVTFEVKFITVQICLMYQKRIQEWHHHPCLIHLLFNNLTIEQYEHFRETPILDWYKQDGVS